MELPAIKPIYMPISKPMSVAVFLSGTGTNFIAIYDEIKRLHSSAIDCGVTIDAVFTNAPNCKGAQKAGEYGIPVLSLSSKRFLGVLDKDPDDEDAREYYDAAVITLLESVCEPDIIVLAGYRRRLGSLFLKRYADSVINLYPGDTTKGYLVRGVDASVQAIRAGEDSIQCTVFLQREKERFGPALVQSAPISIAGFTESDKDEMNEKIRREGEWKAFPYAIINLLAEGKLAIDVDDNIYLDSIRLDLGGYQLTV